MTARILVIEDDPASLELMFYLLSAHGYSVTTAARGDEGLAAARSQRLDLVVCDIQLPGIDGLEIATRLKADPATRPLALVAVTALAMVGDRERVMAAGFDAYVSKPIDPSTFVQQVEPLLQPELRRSLASGSRSTGTVPRRAPPHTRILVVDDQDANVELKRSILEPFGFEVLAAAACAAALALVREHSPALIISDIGVRGASGFELLSAVKSDPALRHIPIIITATHTDASTREQALRLGACRFLLRPLEAPDVLREVESCLNEVSGGRGDGKDPGR